MVDSNILKEHETLILEAMKMKASVEKNKDQEKISIDRLNMLKNKTMETYSGFDELKDSLKSLGELKKHINENSED